MKYLIAMAFVLNAALSFAHETTTRKFQGITDDNKDCLLKITRYTGTKYVLRENGGTVTSYEPEPGYTPEKYDSYSIDAEIKGDYQSQLNVSGEYPELAPALTGNTNSFKKVDGSNLNLGIGKRKVSMELRNGTPISAKLHLIYFFSTVSKYECNNLTELN